MKTLMFISSLCIAVTSVGCGADSTAVVATEGEPTITEDELWGLGENPQTWRSFWYAKYAHRLGTTLEAGEALPPTSASLTVLLIPGTTIGPEFFAPMAARLRRDGYDVVVWAPADLFTDDLATGGARIGAKVEEVLRDRGLTRLSIVAQCDAGVAARYYATVLGGAARLDRLVTFVSAHHGSSAAPAAAWVTSWPALRDIKPGSAFMTRLNGAPLPVGLHFTSIYSCWDEYLWPASTSQVPGATNVEYCQRYVSHFSPFWDPVVYSRIRSALRE